MVRETPKRQRSSKDYEKARTRTFPSKWEVGRPWLIDGQNGMTGCLCFALLDRKGKGRGGGGKFGYGQCKRARTVCTSLALTDCLGSSVPINR